MEIGVIRYPGSNCDFDALRYFNGSFIWHKEEIEEHQISILDEKHFDLIVIPGGFAFGDRIYDNATGNYKISPGEMAKKSPVTDIILEAHKRGIPLLGICNGFQILIKLGLLPGELNINKDQKFHAKNVKCAFSDGTVYKLPIANKFGNYRGDILEEQIFLKYKNYDTEVAGICQGNVYGMMPHPERLPDNKILKNKLISIILSHYNIIDKDIIKIMHSEHVSYRSTKKYLKRLYTKGEHVIQGPGENAGIIDIGGDYALCLRIESHNHPIFINPFQGAATGVGGILRDIFTMGARPIALLDFLRFGTDSRAKEIEEGVIHGISDYGNCIGVPVVGGEIYRDKVYNKNPLLNVACIGIVKKENIIYGHAEHRDSFLVYIGARTGLEGVGGADMASKQFGKDVSHLADNIQTGDAYLEKLLLEVCCELSENNLLEGMQDMGAGGLLCSSLELIQRGREKFKKNLGCDIYLDKVPVKYSMKASDILISESQERMLLVCNMFNYDNIKSICNKWDLESEIIGKVTNTGHYKVVHNDKTIYNKDITTFENISFDWYPKNYKYTKPKKCRVKSERWTQYDNTLGGRTIKGPLEPGSFAILNLHEIGKKLFITWGQNFDECKSKMNNFSVKNTAVVNCMNFGHPKECIGSFEEVINDLTKKCKKYKIPVIGGNVSLYNSTEKISIPPSPVIMMVGIEK